MDIYVIIFSGKRIVRLSERLLITNIEHFIDEHIDEELTVNRLCDEFNIKRTRLYELMSSYIDGGIASFIKTKRLSRAKELLQTTDMSVAEIANSVGFSEEELMMIKKLSKDLHISQSEAVRQFVSKDKIIVVKVFEKLLPLLGAVANIIQNGERIFDEYEKLKLEVYRIWKEVYSNEKPVLSDGQFIFHPSGNKKYGYINTVYVPNISSGYIPSVYRRYNGAYYPVLTYKNQMITAVDEKTDICSMIMIIDDNGNMMPGIYLMKMILMLLLITLQNFLICQV